MEKDYKLTAFFIFIIFILLPGIEVSADRGSFSFGPARISQDSQKAIIFHNKKEEILILATELKADRQVQILEFIPFPSEPAVCLVKGQPFEKVNELLKKKDVEMEKGISKGGSAAAPVEIKLSQKIGVHEVTVVKINEPQEFEKWVKEFFSGRSQRLENNLDRVIQTARDYLTRGLNYFVFDSVDISQDSRLIEPLAYRFVSDKLYYPLKTSNIVGGEGAVELILILPGSFWLEEMRDERYFSFFRSGWKVSSSSKMYPDDLAAIYPEAKDLFSGFRQVYLQLLHYSGPYSFKEDLLWEVSSLPPYAYKFSFFTGYGLDYEQKMTEDEMKDYLEAKCLEDENFLKNPMFLNEYLLGYMLTSGCTCLDFIHPEEYLVYEAVFHPETNLDGLPTGEVLLEPVTLKMKVEYQKGLEKTLIDNFNEKNKKEYNLKAGLPDGQETFLRFRDSESSGGLRSGKTFVSRVGFNPNKTEALVFVSHVADPEMGVGYLLLLGKKAGQWKLSGVFGRQIY